ncbi:hypothetical protein II654_00290, partial [bacterium]|nr:hypothetical protein [bacterium]
IMLFKSISIPNTKNKSLQKIASKNFNFTNKFQYWKVANFVILIGDNGSGKSTLINLLKTNYY